jgi:hypothetical protein
LTSRIFEIEYWCRENQININQQYQIENNMKTKITVKSLRQQNHLVKVTHLRRVIISKKFLASLSCPEYRHIAKGEFNLPPVNILAPQTILSRGGETVLTVDLKNGNHYLSNTICSNSEPYSKKRGLKVCLDRLYNQMKENGDI